jgi:hypothetical protein
MRLLEGDVLRAQSLDGTGRLIILTPRPSLDVAWRRLSRILIPRVFGSTDFSRKKSAALCVQSATSAPPEMSLLPDDRR